MPLKCNKQKYTLGKPFHNSYNFKHCLRPTTTTIKKGKKKKKKQLHTIENDLLWQNKKPFANAKCQRNGVSALLKVATYWWFQFSIYSICKYNLCERTFRIAIDSIPFNLNRLIRARASMLNSIQIRQIFIERP